jgi:hypothetical protein
MALGAMGVPLTAKEALTLNAVNQSRCREGYLFDETRNRKVVAEDPALQDLWSWIERESVNLELNFVSNAYYRCSF